MELESIRRYLEGDDKDETATDSLPKRFHESITMKDLRVDFAEPGRVVCSMEVPPRLVDSGNCLHSAAMAMLVDVVGWSAMLTIGTSSGGVTVEINISYMDAARVGVYLKGNYIPYTEERGTGSFLVITAFRLSNRICSSSMSVGNLQEFLYEDHAPNPRGLMDALRGDGEDENEEIAIEAKTLRVGKAVTVVNVEFTKKKTGEIIAQGRQTKYQPLLSSKI